MIYVAYAVNFLLMIIMPLVLARFIARRRRVGWGLFAMGAVTFIASQIGHIPFNWLVLQRFALLPADTAVLSNLIILALFVGLSAGVFEEGARYLTYRYWATEARTWGKGLMLGAGHGGAEAIILGLLGGVNFVVLAAMRNGAFLDQIPAEQLPLLEAQLTTMFTAPWYSVLLGAAERLFALSAHLAMSLLVMQVFTRGQIRWLFASILWHTLLNAAAVIAVSTWNVYITEAIVGLMALFSLAIIFRLRTPEPVAAAIEPLPTAGPARLAPGEVTAEMLERSRYD
jgi:uncharacterized membrane protein YhfC